MAIMASCITWLNLSQELNYDASKNFMQLKLFNCFPKSQILQAKSFCIIQT